MCERSVLFFFFAGGASVADRKRPTAPSHAAPFVAADGGAPNAPKPPLAGSSADIPKPPPPPPPGAPKAPKPPAPPPAPAESCVNGFTVAPDKVAPKLEKIFPPPEAHVAPPAKGLLLLELDEPPACAKPRPPAIALAHPNGLLLAAFEDPAAAAAPPAFEPNNPVFAAAKAFFAPSGLPEIFIYENSDTLDLFCPLPLPPSDNEPPPKPHEPLPPIGATNPPSDWDICHVCGFFAV